VPLFGLELLDTQVNKLEGMTMNSILRKLSKKMNPWFFVEEPAIDPCTYHVSQGDFYNSNKQWLQAIEHYRKALAIKPALAPIWIQLGHGHRETGQFELAEQSYLRALDHEPGNSDGTFFLNVTRTELELRRQRERQTAKAALPNEPPCQATEPPGFRFQPQDLPSFPPRLGERSTQKQMSALHLSSQVVGFVHTDAPETPDMINVIHAFGAISGPGRHDGEIPGSLKVDRVRPLSVNGSGLKVADIWFFNSHALRLRFEPDGAADGRVRVLRCFQYDPRDLERVSVIAEQWVSTDLMAFADISMANPYLPLLFSVCAEDGETLALTLLPFPSLCRGGLHYGELLAVDGSKPYLQVLQNVSSSLLQGALKRGGRPALDRIAIDLDAATGTERIFERAFQFWLRRVLGVSFEIGHVPSDMDSDVQSYFAEIINAPAPNVKMAQDQVLMRLSADTVPSLHGIMLDWVGRTGFQPVPFILASTIDATPKWLLRPPSGEAYVQVRDECAGSFPVIEMSTIREERRSTADIADRASIPVGAIRLARIGMSDEAEVLAPVPSRLSSSWQARTLATARAFAITVIHSYSGNEKTLAAMLEALALQQPMESLEVLIAVRAADAIAIQPLLERLFSNRARLVLCPDEEGEGARLNRAAARAATDLILILGDAVLPHDPHTLTHLASLMAVRSVASASCMLVGPRIIRKVTKHALVTAGYFSFINFPPDLAAMISGVDEVLSVLPRTAWSAACNSSRLFMVRNADWRRMGGFVDHRHEHEELGTAFWRNATAEGRLHLVTTAHSASLLASTGEVVSCLKIGSDTPFNMDETGSVSLSVQRLGA
jgi:hypothetical protein